MVEFFTSQVNYSGWYAFLGTLVLISYFESIFPRRSLDKPIRIRWARNCALFVTSTLIVRLAVPVLGVEVARFAMEQRWGLLLLWEIPLWASVVIGVLVLDLARYGLHRAAHRYALLWRMHRLHHTDQEFDFTTSLRFHPIELGLITITNIVVIIAFGLHPLSVLILEAVSLSLNTLNHGNLRIPLAVDRVLRIFVVTPDMHRVHHSALAREFNANLGGLVPWWDRLFGTYVAQPRKGHLAMDIGLPGYEDNSTTFLKLLLDPFTSAATQFKDSRGSNSGNPSSHTTVGAVHPKQPIVTRNPV